MHALVGNPPTVVGLLSAPSAAAALAAEGVTRRWSAFRGCLALGRTCTAALPTAPLPFATLEAHYRELWDKSRVYRGLASHCYAGYCGPWLENAWISAFGADNLTSFYPLVPLFLQITDICVSGDAHAISSLGAFFSRLRSDVMYVTVVQHDKGLCFLHDSMLCTARNVLVLSAGGWGNVALPLLKGAAPYYVSSDQPHNTAVAAVNSDARVAAHLLGFAGLLDTHPGGFRIDVMTELRRALERDDQLLTFNGSAWRSVMLNTALPLAPRGYGRSSFRMAELVQLGLPQAVIWNDVPWLPYFNPMMQGSTASGRTDVWGDGGLGVHSNFTGLSALVARLCFMMLPAELNATDVSSVCPPGALPPGPPYVLPPSSALARMAARAAELAESHFSYAGVMDRIREFLATPWDADLVCVALPATRN